MKLPKILRRRTTKSVGEKIAKEEEAIVREEKILRTLKKEKEVREK